MREQPLIRNEKGQFKKGYNKLYGPDNPYYGKKHSEDTRKKMSKSRQGKKPVLGKSWKLSTQACFNISQAKIGSKNPAWKDGRTTLKERIYKTYKYHNWRQQVFIRDNFTCRKCGEVGGRLEAHHIKPYRKLIEEAGKNLPLYPLYDSIMIYTPMWDINNGKTLCKKCHLRLKRGRYK